METRMKKYRQVSPEKAKVRTEKSLKYHQNRKVPVVYYLCRNRQLQHPHFMEVPLSSPDGLYLKDVIERLNVLRGRGMASLYSWSCKRSYKSGFVWHDLSEDDLILLAHENEYVLKGSELFEDSSSDHFSPIGNMKIQNLKQLPQPPSSRSNDDSSSSSSMNGKGTRHSQEEELSSVQYPGSYDVSPESRSEKNGSLRLTEYRLYKNDGLADASTQTEENVSRSKTRETCARGVSADDQSLEHESNEVVQTQVLRVVDNSEIRRDTIFPSPSTSCPSSSGARTETLESLMRADASKLNSFKILEREELRMPANARLKSTNMLLQLISCGSISVKDHSFGLVPTYKSRFSHSKFASPFFSSSFMLGDLDCISDNSRLMSFRLGDKEYFSGSLIETKLLQGEGDGHRILKRSSSYNADRIHKQPDSVDAKEDSASGHSKCILRSIEASSNKQPKSESLRSPLPEGRRNSSDRIDSCETLSLPASNGSSKRITEPSSSRMQSQRIDSLREEKKVIKIEENFLQELGL